MIDVGGGVSPLAGEPLDRGFRDGLVDLTIASAHDQLSDRIRLRGRGPGILRIGVTKSRTIEA